MSEPRHHIGEWTTAVFEVPLPSGLIAYVPVTARDAEAANVCVRMSLGLLGYACFRAIGSQVGGQG